MEEQPKNEGFFTKIWNKTIFSDMVKNAKEEKAMRREIQQEAKIEARDEIKEILKQQYIEKEKAKITGKGKGSGILAKLGNEFKSMGDSVGKKDIGAMMGGTHGGGSRNSIVNDDKISNMLGQQRVPSSESKIFGESPVSDEKIRKMLGR